ncbi:Leucine Rich Repeat family protein [Histomonas meleagridis]|nr:Leucine Rich Repeat family protein [Histomonas meleagridis]
MSQLRVLRLENNPIVDQCQHYRRSVIHLCKILTYLDDSTVDTNERLLVESYYEGGHQREQFIRQRIKEEKRRKEEISFREVRRMQRERLLSKGGNIDEYPELKSSDDDEEQYCNDNSNEIESVD